MGMYALAQAGSADALASLVRQHIPLVQALAKRFSFSEDVFQQGCLGLVHAIRHFREDSGFQFSTYACPVILGEMRKAFSRGLGWRAQRALRKAKQYQDHFFLQFGREPSIGDAAAHAGISAEELLLLMERTQPPVTDGEKGFSLSLLPDPQGEAWLTAFFIRDILSRLPRDEEWLLRQRFIRGRSQQQLARAMGAHQSTVSRKEKNARQRFITAWLETP